MKGYVTMACDVSHDMERHRKYCNNDISRTVAGISCPYTFKCLNCKENYKGIQLFIMLSQASPINCTPCILFCRCHYFHIL